MVATIRIHYRNKGPQVVELISQNIPRPFEWVSFKLASGRSIFGLVRKVVNNYNSGDRQFDADLYMSFTSVRERSSTG